MIPDTNYQIDAKFCSKGKTYAKSGMHESLVVKCDEVYSGKYFLFHLYLEGSSSKRTIDINELYMYAKLLNKAKTHVSLTTYKNVIKKIIRDGSDVSTDILNIMQDAVYYLSSSLLEDVNIEIEILTDLIYLNTICISCSNEGIAADDETVEITDYFKNEIVTTKIKGDFLSQHTTCGTFNTVFSKYLKLLSLRKRPIFEIELSATTIASKECL
ncbi:DgyrCDS14742 [Dimorphilus gyrociliatus]|uniref:DgyrCDS14742 n=1 Tax=Dimorphilus gyrociliatus TaxID=2664684 RepID=A0A7I8WEN5_9ANNE|nr:DgyrCDS14742 [Dimorphilus gyrociliatus]